MSKRPIQFEDILSDEGIEERLREVPISSNSFYSLIVVLGVIIAISIVQFVNLNIRKHTLYTARALDNVSDAKITVAPRGIIEDRTGAPLVKNIPSFNVWLYPRLLPLNNEERRVALTKLSGMLGMNEEELWKKIEERDWNKSDKILLSSDITQEQLVELSTSEGLGVRIEEGFTRAHTVPLIFSQVLGYTGLVGKNDMSANEELVMDDQIGRGGLESYYDEYLRGINGKQVSFKNAKGEIKSERVEREPAPGNNVHTYIDKDFQEYFYNTLKTHLETLGRDVGVGLAFNPKNGEVLALVSVPGFDTKKIGNAIMDTRRPLFNRAVSGLYNPGSTIKPLVGIGALTDAIIDPLKQILSIGYIELPNPYNPDAPSRFVDWRPQGWVDMRAALARSSNVYFYEVGGGFQDQKGLGINGLKKRWQLFGLDRKTEIDLPGENTGFLPDPDWKQKKTGQPWRIGDTYNVSIGQGDFSITPLELLNYISAVANGGTFYKPRVVESITDTKGKEVFRSYPSTLFSLADQIGKALPVVREGMRDAVTKSYGTAYLLSSLPVEVAAKTGTAQIENNAKTNAFFVGYAPYKDPEIAILILVENAREGSSNTVPVAKDVMLWYYNNRLRAD
jgi:penicillin-binding protein 2